MSESLIPSRKMVVKASNDIKSLVLKTPLIPSEDIALGIGATDVRIRAESLQKSDSFKIRGASYGCSKLRFPERIYLNRMDLIRKFSGGSIK